MTTHDTETRVSTSARRIVLLLIDLALPVATVAMMAVFATTTASFMSINNMMAILSQNAYVFVVAVAFAMLLMSGYVDLSVGSVLALAGVSAAMAFNAFGFWPGLLMGLGVGIVSGAINGTLIGVLQLSPIVVTLGMLAGARGLAQVLAPESVFGFPAHAVTLGSGSFLGVSYLTVIAIIVAAVGLIIMLMTPWGKRIIAVGVNPRAAFLVGVSVKSLVFWLYVGVGAAVGLAAILQISRIDSAPSGTLGTGFEVTMLTAVLLGGIPFTGGRGNLFYVILGVWFISVLKNGLTLLNIGTEMAGVITGAVLISAAGLEALRIRMRST